MNQSHTTKLSIFNFINNQLVHFSIANCKRSIPSLMDGLKTGQRKILYCALKRNLKEGIANFG
jgi:DNA topoisomerase-2